MKTYVLFAVALAVALYAVVNNNHATQPVSVSLSPADLAKAYLLDQAAQNEESLGRLTCKPFPINAWKMSVVCTEVGTWGRDKVTVDLLRSAWQIASPTSP